MQIEHLEEVGYELSRIDLRMARERDVHYCRRVMHISCKEKVKTEIIIGK